MPKVPFFKAAPGLQHVKADPKRFVVHGATRRQRQVDYLSGDAVQEAPQVMERDVQPIQGHGLASARPTGSLEAPQQLLGRLGGKRRGEEKIVEIVKLGHGTQSSGRSVALCANTV